MKQAEDALRAEIKSLEAKLHLLKVALATLDYGISEALGVSVIFPWVDRAHEHIHNHRGEPELESWNFSGLGDMRVVLP